jgi:hypothetical protein
MGNDQNGCDRRGDYTAGTSITECGHGRFVRWGCALFESIVLDEEGGMGFAIQRYQKFAIGCVLTSVEVGASDSDSGAILVADSEITDPRRFSLRGALPLV